MNPRRGGNTRAHAMLLAWGLSGVVLPYPAGAGELAGFDCLVEPYVVVDVSTRETGILESFEVERGDLVEQGQLLGTLESTVEKATLELATARTNMAALIDERKESLEFARRQQARMKELYDKKAAPFHEMDKAETDTRLAAIRLRQTEHDQRVARLELRRARAALELRRINSPIRGVVMERLLSAGESVEDRPILKLAQIDPLNVRIIVPVAEFGRVVPGMRAEVRPVGPAFEPRIATTTVVDRVVDAASGTFAVRLEMPNPDYLLPGGLTCEIRFIDPPPS